MSGSSSFVECIRVMVKNAAREKLVRQLSALAVKCGLEAVNSQASSTPMCDGRSLNFPTAVMKVLRI